MKSVSETLLLPLRTRAASLSRAVNPLLLHLWDVFSAPSPSGRDVLTLLCLCLTLSSLTGLLLHRWLSGTLRYQSRASLQAACIHSVSLFLVTSLFHPLRCVLTLVLPTVCTKQGRKLLLSASAMVVVLNVLPNISLNVGAITRVLKCSAEGFTKTLLNSSHPFNEAKRELVEEVVRVRREDLSLVQTLRTLNQVTRVDVSEVKSRFAEMIAQIEGNFSQARTVLGEYKLLSNRVLAAVFVALLVAEAARDLKSYLTSLQFNNKDLLRRKPPVGDPRPTKRQRCRITSEELTSSFLSLILVTLSHVSMLAIVLLDYVVYHIVQTIVPWFLDFPPTSAIISVDYKVSWFPPVFCLLPHSCHSRELSTFHREYRWDFSPEPALCGVTASPPNPGVVLLLGSLWILSYSLVLLEVYAKRLRRKISASFFREQEERRGAHLRRRGGELT